MATIKCYFCAAPLKPNMHRCHECKTWNWTQAAFKPGDDGSVLFEDVRSAEENRITTGLIDENVGGGLVDHAVILIGGLPGAGKSTMLLQLAGSFCQLKRPTMYIAAEEGLEAIKARGDRLGINTRGLLRFIPALGGIADIGGLLLHYKPGAIILDSLDGLVGHDSAQEIKCLEVLTKYAVGLKAPCLVVSQVNKDADYSGLMAKQHAVDCLLTMMPDESIKIGDEPVRCIETLKNRHGRAFVRSFFEMTAAGLVKRSAEDLLEELEPDSGDENEP